MKRPEILAPAGSIESIKAAVYCGADAVYLGSKSMNARRNASNFTDEELKQTVTFCHERGVKVYQTLNILMLDNEVDEAIETIKTCAMAGVDAVIVQDLGVLSLVKQIAPELAIHASTQMAVHNLAGAIEAVRLGCKQIVVARELSLPEIKNIAENCGAPVEVFVHGALCMSVSGQCYLSSILGQRSGNRGLCAQPCRLPFVIGDETHALSLKDLSLVNYVIELQDAGVSSLKIEGRMKRPEYVAAAVTAVKSALDGINPDLHTLQSVFSRNGFTSAYYDGKMDKTMFGTRGYDDVVATSNVLGELAELYHREQPRIALEGKFIAKEGQVMEFIVTDDEGHKATITGEIPEIAINKPTDEEKLRASLNKTGGTPYFFKELNITLDEGLLLKSSQLNLLRRTAIEDIMGQRNIKKTYTINDTVKTIVPLSSKNKKPLIRVRLRLEQLTTEVIELADELLILLDEVKEAISYGADSKKIIAEIPRILFTGEDDIIGKLECVQYLGVTRAWAGNIGAVALAAEAGMTVSGGWGLNITNAHAATVLSDSAVQDIELSFELRLLQAKAISNIKRGILAYGKLPLMTFRSCPIKARMSCAECKKNGELVDRMDAKFRVSCESGFVEMFNPVALFLADRYDELIGFDFLTLWFTGEEKEDVLKITRQYINPSKNEKLQSNHTRGLYYRGII